MLFLVSGDHKQLTWLLSDTPLSSKAGAKIKGTSLLRFQLEIFLRALGIGEEELALILTIPVENNPSSARKM